ncbi:hypothetical protein OIO90_005658 [Microbotryomycetes sp. JL221]|nr:hypothetical protein OIO90_005658 [Microbotryomycetes sp. JL221]
MSSTQSIPKLLHRLSTTCLHQSPPSSSFVLPLLVSTTCGQSKQWLKHVYEFATLSCSSSSSSISLTDIQQQMKEALLKASILIGVPKTIEARLELETLIQQNEKESFNANVDNNNDNNKNKREENFARSHLKEFKTLKQTGQQGLQTIYQKDIDSIFDMMTSKNMKDIIWLSQHVTYGIFLTPFVKQLDEQDKDSLSFDQRMLSIVTLSCLIPQRTEREILWHLRGALRRGMTRDEVELVHEAIAQICQVCGVENVRHGMPSIKDVSRQEEEENDE